MNRKIIFLFSIVALLTLLFYYLSNQTQGKYYKSYSPDGQYSRYVSKSKYFNFQLPFSRFGDASGKVFIYDEIENKLVGSSDIDMISNISETEWHENEFVQKGHFEIELPRPIDSRMIEKYLESKPVINSWSIYVPNHEYKVKRKGNILTVLKRNGDTIFNKIKYIGLVQNQFFQVLNLDSEIEYYDLNLENIYDSVPVSDPLYLEICDCVNSYSYKIEKSKDYFFIKKAESFCNNDFQDYKKIDSITIKDVKDIYFLDGRKSLEFDSNFFKDEEIIIDHKNYFGIWSEGLGIQYFDTVDISSFPIKVKRDSLYGYYNTSSVMYKKLDPYEFNLAFFIDKKNRKGYLDNYGKRYY